MPYTKTRLEHALKIFRENPSKLLARGLASRSAAHNLRSYHLRSPQKIIYDYDGPSRRGCKNSDDDEYDPSEERRRSNAAAKRKKIAQKRKAEVEGDTDKQTKKSRQGKSGAKQTAHVTLRIFSEEGKKLLADIAATTRAISSQERYDGEYEVEQSQFKPQDIDRGLLMGGCTSNMEQGWINDHAEVLTVGLRNGKVPNKQIDRGRASKSEKSSRDLYEKDGENTQDYPSVYLENNTSKEHQHSPGYLDNTELNISPSREQEQIPSLAPTSLKPRRAAESAKTTEPRRPQIPPRRTNQVDLYTNGVGLESMETHYAHPINFHSIQMPCDFCGNYRMGIIGLGKRVVSVYRNPSDPSKLEEAGDGWRAEGYPETKMCTVCGLERLMIARCHAPKPQDGMASGSSSSSSRQSEAQFTRITTQSYGDGELNAYVKDLFDRTKRPVQFRDPNPRGVDLPHSCSLCPLPAIWRCCKVQQGDATNEECGTFMFQKNYKEAEETINGKKRAVVCLDSDTEDDEDASLLPPAKRRRVDEKRTPTPIRFSPVASTASFQIAARAKATLGGCGLRLCNHCKIFLEGQCDGKLSKARVWKYLRNENKFGPRADVRFLFGGSDLEKAHFRVGGGGGGRGIGSGGRHRLRTS